MADGEYVPTEAPALTVVLVLPVETLPLALTRVVLVLPVGFLVALPVLVLPLDLPAAVFALAAMAALALPEPVEVVTRVVRKEPRTASSSSCARALAEAHTTSARPRMETRILWRIITPR